MRDGRCPKCGSDKVHVSNLTIGPPNRVLLNAVLIAYSAWRGATTAALAQYVCIQCG